VNSRVMTSGWNVGSAADRAVLVMGGSRGNAVPDSAPDRAQRECAVEKALTRTTSVPATSKTAVGVDDRKVRCVVDPGGARIGRVDRMRGVPSGMMTEGVRSSVNQPTSDRRELRSS
jgi:hypothetical protein